ncbi:hypothetical protein Clacol_006910 [Clathrus columnatus]|uniref:Endonuclease/exonuclease/phosphatase domain-containing protein n=1 Tax=Clathrus columnatus TaxID=1419009 RepID=A0AAV5AJK7_9AGAM|nr:hypothetical protein Clacol_006910 [Clathrus columnatus]
MPPKRTASTSKRKATPSDDEDTGSETPKPSKKRTKKPAKELVSNGQPNNTVLPVIIIARFTPTLHMFTTILLAEDADILVLTETKVNEKPANLLQTMYPYQYWSISSTKGYAGTAILCKHKPLNVKLDFPTHPEGEAAAKGRIVALEYSTLWIVGTYVPNAGQNLKNIEYKVAWNDAFANYLYELNKQKPVIWMGDINCAPTPKDLSNSKTNWNKTPGHTQQEVDGFNKILKLAPPDNSTTETNEKLVDVPLSGKINRVEIGYV